jgi:hypothetical protein
MTKQRAGFSWKTFWSTLAPVLAGVFAGLALLVDMPPWAAVTLIASAAAAVGVVGHRVATRSPMFEPLDSAAQRTVWVWVAIAAACYAVWATIAVLRGRELLWWWVLDPALGGLTYLTARGHEYVLTRLRRPAQQPRRTALALTAGPHVGAEPALPVRRGDEPILVWLFAQALTLVGLAWLTVISYEPVIDADDGENLGYRFRLRRPVRMAVPHGKGVRQVTTPKPPEDAANRIAMALSAVSRISVAPEWVQITQATDRAGDLDVLVLTVDVLGKIRPYKTPAEPTWTSVLKPTPMTWDMTGSPFAWDWLHHGRLIGGTQWGKSSAIQRMMLALATAHDAIYWAASVEKFYDLVAPVVQRYLNTTYRPPLDWLAWDAEGMLDMLITAMHIVRWRQRQPHATRKFKKIYIFLDEVSFATRMKGVYGRYQGQRVTISKMLAMLAQAGESAGVYLVLASQRGVQGHLGDHGGDVAPNMGWSVALRTSDNLDTGRVVGQYRLPRLALPGQSYIESPGKPTTCVRWEYPQTADPSKPVYDPTAPTVEEAFWALRGFQTHREAESETTSPRELDAGSVKAAAQYGPAYADRHRYVTDELLAALMGADIDDAGPAEPAQAGGGMRDALFTMLRLRGVPPPDAATAPAGNSTPNGAARSSVAVLSAYQSIPQRILNHVRAAGGHAQRAEIIAALQKADPELSEQSIQNALSELVNIDGKLCRPTDEAGKPIRGLYAIAS